MKSYYSIILILILFMNSCVTSNHTTNNRLIQKRKYTKGWHLNSKSVKKSHSKSHKEVCLTEVSNSVKKQIDTRLNKNHTPQEPNSKDGLANTTSKNDSIVNSYLSGPICYTKTDLTTTNQIPKKEVSTNQSISKGLYPFRNVQIVESSKQKPENKKNLLGVILLFILSLIVVLFIGFGIALLFYSETAFIIALVILLIIDIILFVRWSNNY